MNEQLILEQTKMIENMQAITGFITGFLTSFIVYFIFYKALKKQGEKDYAQLLDYLEGWTDIVNDLQKRMDIEEGHTMGFQAEIKYLEDEVYGHNKKDGEE